MQAHKEWASITSIAYHLGQRKPIDELDFLQDDPKRLELYRLAGFDSFRESDLSMRELAYRSVVQTLEAGEVAPKDIGVCLYVAESFDRDEPVNSAEVNRLLLDLGLENTVPIHISVANCANIVAALRVAMALIRAQETCHVLIISVDKASHRYAGRKMFQEMSIKSDVSLSCLVSAPGMGAYGILGVAQHNAASLVEGDLSDPASYAMSKFRCIRNTAKRAREILDLSPKDFTRVITNNYGREVMNMFIELCGFSKRAGYFENIGRFAHAVAGDVLINLKDLEIEGGVKPGDRIFLMADSVTSSSVLCVQKC